MNDLNNIYQELGEHICLYPFFGAFYQTNNVIPTTESGMNNSVRPCSIIMSEDRWHWCIQDHETITESRNNKNWKELRQKFLNGEFHNITECRSCSFNELAGTTSPRMMNNKFYSEFLSLDIVEEVKSIVANDNTVKDIITLDYYPSNYCNYSCVMCDAGASSQRHTFEVKILNRDKKIVINDIDKDFYDILDRVEIINFTGGETILQSQVHNIIDYLIEKDLAKNILITLLSNASSSPDKMTEKFKKFKQVIYNVSVDGVGEIIEYQRRGCSWAEVEANAIKLMNHEVIVSVINYVLTAINALSAMDFVDWAYANKFGRKHDQDLCGYLTISPVFRVDHLGVATLPPALRNLALERLRAGRVKYSQLEPTSFNTYFVEIIDRFINIIESTEHRPEYIAQFVDHIRKEDLVSKRPLGQVVPEWAPWF